MVLQLRFLVRCGEDDAIDEVFVAVASPMPVAVENEDSTMSSDYEDVAWISSVAVKENENQLATVGLHTFSNLFIAYL